MSWIFGILILGGVIAFIYVRTRSSPTPAQPLASTALPAAPGRIQPTPENIWGKRLVVNDPGACFAARALAGQCFPLDHVPGLLDYTGCASVTSWVLRKKKEWVAAFLKEKGYEARWIEPSLKDPKTLTPEMKTYYQKLKKLFPNEEIRIIESE